MKIVASIFALLMVSSSAICAQKHVEPVEPKMEDITLANDSGENATSEIFGGGSCC